MSDKSRSTVYRRTYAATEALSFARWIMVLSCYCFILLFIGAGTSQSEHLHDETPVSPFIFDASYYHLHLKLEEVLMKKQDYLEGLRVGILSVNETSSVTFQLKITVDNITDKPYTTAAFCPVSYPQIRYWELCSNCLDTETFLPKPVNQSEMKSSTHMNLVSPLIIVVSLIHGNLLSIYVLHYPCVLLFLLQQRK